jgi:hypothetical protein
MPEFVKKIVKDVLEKLGRPALPVANMPVDLHRRVAGIKQKLAEHSGSIVLGLHGMGGIGKTTLAKAVYNDLRADFVDSNYFLSVGRDADDAKLPELQKQLLKELCGSIDLDISHKDYGRQQLEQRMGSRRVLLVIDDVWTSGQLDALLVSAAPGSRVLVTTRDMDLLHHRHGINLKQLVEQLDERAGLELLCWHAFLAEQPPEAYKDLARQAARACSGLPLSLAVVGSYLWDQRDLEGWKLVMDELQTAIPFGGGRLKDDQLWGTLKLSFDALNNHEQRMFLDIACFMLGRDAIKSKPAWGRRANSFLRHLRSRSLVGLDEAGHLTIHDQLRDMGRAIVVEKSISHPSHVWMPDARDFIRRMSVRSVCHTLLYCCGTALGALHSVCMYSCCAVLVRLLSSNKEYVISLHL